MKEEKEEEEQDYEAAGTSLEHFTCLTWTQHALNFPINVAPAPYSTVQGRQRVRE